MNEYLLLFRGGDARRTEEQKDPARWQAHMMKWKTWMEGLGQQGKFVSGQPLGIDGSVITGSGKTVTDGPFTEGKEIVGGFVMIKASDKKEAIALAKDCPLLEHDGIIEVREVKELSM